MLTPGLHIYMHFIYLQRQTTSKFLMFKRFETFIMFIYFTIPFDFNIFPYILAIILHILQDFV